VTNSELLSVEPLTTAENCELSIERIHIHLQKNVWVIPLKTTEELPNNSGK
jgi:hypothetical protein